MKQRKISKRESLIFMSVITLFVFIVSLSSLYISNLIGRGELCRCIIPVPIMIVVLSSLGLFVGSFTYYLVFSRFSFEREKIGSNAHKTIQFLSKDERAIVEALIKNPKGISQSRLGKESGLGKVKTHRILKKLGAKKLVSSIELGRSKIIMLSDELRSVFCK